MFTDTDSTITRDGFSLTVRIEPDCDNGTPWDNEDGHGPVSKRDTNPHVSRPMYKKPGELVLCSNRHGPTLVYDYRAACEIARRDGWGVSPYRTDIERGANGLVRVTTQHFDHERNLSTFDSGWCDDINDAYRAVHNMHRATMSARAYAALAAMADYERLRQWCNGDWCHVGVIVTASRNGIKLGSASLWGIESDATEYLLEVANELADEAISDAQAAIAALTE